MCKMQAGTPMADKETVYSIAITKMNDFLSSKGKSLDIFPPSKRERYITVAVSVWTRRRKIEEALETIKENAISIASVSKATCISNKTFYNDPVLKEFIETNSMKRKDNSGYISSLRCEIEEKNKMIEKMMSNAIDVVEMKEELKMLQKENLRLLRRLESTEMHAKKNNKDTTTELENNNLLHINFETGELLDRD